MILEPMKLDVWQVTRTSYTELQGAEILLEPNMKLKYKQQTKGKIVTNTIHKLPSKLISFI